MGYFFSFEIPAQRKILKYGILMSNDRMNAQGLVYKFAGKIWKEIEEPLEIIVSGAILFFITALFLKIGIIILRRFFTEESWFLEYLDILSVSVLILSYLIFVTVRLTVYCYHRIEEIKKGKRGMIV